MELDDSFHIWKIKLQLAQQGNSQALQDIKSQSTNSNPNFSFIENNLHDALRNANIKSLKEGQTYGDYELYNEVPVFLLLSGELSVKCLNLQGDEEEIMKVEEKGAVVVSKDKIVSKFGEANLNIVTKFQLTCLKDSILIELNDESRRKIEAGEKDIPSLVGLRQQTIMKKYMLFPLKYIRIQEFGPNNKNFKCEQKFYLLQGRACYYLQKGKERILLTVYEEGYINPKQFTGGDIVLYIFQNSRVLIFEEEFMRDDVVAATEVKRSEHVHGLVRRYETLGAEEKKKIQIKLINNFKLNKKEVDRAVYGITEAVSIAKDKDQNSRRISTKNDLISTSSSIKEKCKIRISKTKKKAA